MVDFNSGGIRWMLLRLQLSAIVMSSRFSRQTFSLSRSLKVTMWPFGIGPCASSQRIRCRPRQPIAPGSKLTRMSM